MRIGVPTELKNNEQRVAITPAGVDELVRRGHEIWVESGAGLGSRILDAEYARAGARIVDDPDDIWANADLLIKVKEPIASEFHRMREGQVLFTYLHLAASPACAQALVSAGTTAVAYETVQLDGGSLPILAPMSEVAGRLAILEGGHHLLHPMGGRGLLFGGVAGARKANVVVIGGGVAGEHAARSAVGLGANVTIVDISVSRLRQLETQFGDAISTRHSSRVEIAELMTTADLVVGSVLVPGAAAPKLVTDEMVATMKQGSVLVDIAIDQGGCFEGSVPTTHDNPTFAVYDSIYYCVANMPGAVPETSTRALTNATLPYITSIADLGWDTAAYRDSALRRGLNVYQGRITNDAVRVALGEA